MLSFTSSEDLFLLISYVEFPGSAATFSSFLEVEQINVQFGTSLLDTVAPETWKVEFVCLHSSTTSEVLAISKVEFFRAGKSSLALQFEYSSTVSFISNVELLTSVLFSGTCST